MPSSVMKVAETEDVHTSVMGVPHGHIYRTLIGRVAVRSSTDHSAYHWNRADCCSTVIKKKNSRSPLHTTAASRYVSIRLITNLWTICFYMVSTLYAANNRCLKLKLWRINQELKSMKYIDGERGVWKPLYEGEVSCMDHEDSWWTAV